MRQERSIDQTIAAIQDPRLRKYHEREQAFLKGLSETDRGKLTVLRNTPEGRDRLEMWLTYFDDHIGARPWAFQRLLDDENTAMTVVAEFPEWMDPTYLPAERAS